MFNKDIDDIEPMDALLDFVADAVKDAPNLQLPSPELRDFYKNEKNRIIWIDDDITFDMLSVVKKIMQYNQLDKDTLPEDRLPIKIFLNTAGGSVSVMWSIVQAMKISKTPIWTINACNAISAGAHILAAGHKRFALPGSTILIHSGSCAFAGTQEQADSAKKYYDALGKKADDQLLADTEIDVKVFKKKSPFDWYLDTDEALKYKIIDRVIEDFSEIL